MASLAKYFPVTDTQKREILIQYGKNEDSIKLDVAMLRKWLKKQPHIPEIKDDLFLEIILIRNKFDVEKTKEKLDNYFTSKHAFAEFFQELDPLNETIVEAAKYHYICCLPNLTPQNERIYFTTKNLPTDDHFDEKSMFQILSMIGETQFLMDYADSSVLIMDAKQTNRAQMTKFQFGAFTKTTKLFYQSLSGRGSSLHIINVSPAIDILTNFLKMLLPQKLKNRIHFHLKPESLFEIYPKECLPKEIGGTSESAVELSRNIMKSLQEEREYILKRNKNGTNETLRVGKPSMDIELFGADGTFKKINLD